MNDRPQPRPERIAAAARAFGAELSERVALVADALADALATEHQLVAWDREQLIGQLQMRLDDLRGRRFRARGGAPVRILERRDQPLESIDQVWLRLRQGRRVHLEHEPGACAVGVQLMRVTARELGRAVGAPVFTVADNPWALGKPEPAASSAALRIADENPDEPGRWPVVGVQRASQRAAVVEAGADRELAAYVLARAALRRSGEDPRAVKHAFVVGGVDLLGRHLHRLWVGARVGPPDAPSSFAGPVTEAVRDDYRNALEAWSANAEVDTLCEGGELERAGDESIYLAPALYLADWPAPVLQTAGPILVVVRCAQQQARAGAEAVAREGGQIVVVGGGRPTYASDQRNVRGAVLVERLPPGLPYPRPV